MSTPNAIVEYVNAETNETVETCRFYDPGLDENSPYARELKKAGRWHGRHLVYGCGRPLPK